MAITSRQLLERVLRDITPTDDRNAAARAPSGRLALTTLETLATGEPFPEEEAMEGGAEQVRAFLRESVESVRTEIDSLLASDASFARNAEQYVLTPRTRVEPDSAGDETPYPDWMQALWRVFFPAALVGTGNRDAAINSLRSRRAVTVETPNPEPLTSVPDELLFTSNVMLTVPAAGTDLTTLDLPDGMAAKITAAAGEEQQFFYDHPIPIGIAPEANELLYGLKGLARALAWEKEHERVPPEARLTVVVSVSVTHSGLKEVALDYIRHELRGSENLDGLDVYAFTEDDTEVLASILDPDRHVREVFGVDGPYGRHYSFLKAVAALWHVAVDPRIRATFKIDLDQIFPQDELAEQSGRSALEHFTTDLWGARGRDADGEPVELGMIAGGLVNESDIDASLFTPDVPMPSGLPAGEDLFFFRQLPMAISTRAEIMTRYNGTLVADGPLAGRKLDGRSTCLSRVHVTGGTNGILVDQLRRYRPFTPGFIGRAEDQAYLMSVLFDGDGPHLRYLHADGLIMRHDKQAFAGEAIKAAKDGTYIGDLVRTLYFSWYAETVAGGFDHVKAMLDPFTGCFITRTPHTIVTLRLLLHVLSLVGADESERAANLLELAAERISLNSKYLLDRKTVASRYRHERECWNVYYDAIDRLQGDGAARALVAQRIGACKLS